MMNQPPDLLGQLLETGDTSASDTSEVLQCSRRSCLAPAQWQLLWNNPKIHTPDRRKVWLACDEHQHFLVDFLSSRDFLKETLPL